MRHISTTLRRRLTEKWTLLAVLGVLAMALLVGAACGESATATPEPEEPDTTMETDDDAMDDGDAMVSHVRPGRSGPKRIRPRWLRSRRS